LFPQFWHPQKFIVWQGPQVRGEYTKNEGL
jgi:hypothetical protein